MQKMNDGYLTRILSYDPLSPEENNRLAMLAQEGNAQARDLVVLSNSRLVKQLLSKYNCSEFERDDLMQEGLCGILKAIDTYDETKSAFSTHAFYWIRAMILKGIRTMEDFHYDPCFYSKSIRYKKLKNAIGENHSNFTDAELKDFGLTHEDINKIELFLRQTCSLDAISEEYGDSYNASCESLSISGNSLEETIYQKDIKKIVAAEMERLLTEKELFVIRNTYGIGTEENKMTIVSKMMAEQFGEKICSRQRIQQIKTKAENKLRNSEALKSIFFS